jgi:hypothetical protein
MTFLILLFLQQQARATELFCEFKVQGAYEFLSTSVKMIDENTLGDEVTVYRQGTTTVYPLRPMPLSLGELFKFSIVEGYASEIYVTVLQPTPASPDLLQSKISNPEAPEFFKDVPGNCWTQ